MILNSVMTERPVFSAQYRTANFVVTTPDAKLAETFALRAEELRKELAITWLGYELPNWYKPCPIRVTVGSNVSPGGSTSFFFNNGEVYGWDMSIQGSAQRVYDSVIPHEITHMILHSHFRHFCRPLPRWADEGAATYTESQAERSKYNEMLLENLRNGRGIPTSRLVTLKDYPKNPFPLYAQAYSLTEFLINKRGCRVFIQFVEQSMKDEAWTPSVSKYYGYNSLSELQNAWLTWVRKGSPYFNEAQTMLAMKNNKEGISENRSSQLNHTDPAFHAVNEKSLFSGNTENPISGTLHASSQVSHTSYQVPAYSSETETPERASGRISRTVSDSADHKTYPSSPQDWKASISDIPVAPIDVLSLPK